MDINTVKKKFEKIGARIKVSEFTNKKRIRETDSDITIDIKKDKKGEFFEIKLRDLNNTPNGFVTDIDVKDRHLFMLIKEQHVAEEETLRFLCGHDERQWYVAGAPDGASNIKTAKEALMPTEVREALDRLHVKTKDRTKRKNQAFVRQGEWFFIPVELRSVDSDFIFKNEPISRGAGSSPHWVEFLHRKGGTQVHVCRKYPNGLTDEEYEKLLIDDNVAKSFIWEIRTRNAQVYAKGRISHRDHKTIILPDWHLVIMNTEPQSASGKSIVFLD